MPRRNSPSLYVVHPDTELTKGQDHGFLVVVIAVVCNVVTCPQSTVDNWVLAELEKEMATLSSVLAWEIPWTEEPGRLHSMGTQELDTVEQQQQLGE